MGFRAGAGGIGGTGVLFAPPGNVVHIGDTADPGISDALLRADARWSFPAAAVVAALKPGGAADLSGWYAELTDLAAVAAVAAAAGIVLAAPAASGDATGAADTAALAALLTAAVPGDEIRLRPNSTYIVTGLTVPAGVALVGGGTGTVVKLKNAGNASVVTLSGAGARLANLQVDGNKANQTSSLTGGAVVVSADDVTVDSVTVVNAFGIGIYAVNCNRPKITGNTVTDSGYIGIFYETNSVAVADVTGGLIADNLVDRSAVGVGIVEGGIKVHGYVANSRLVTRTRIVRNRVVMPTNPTSAAAICIEVYGGAPYSVIANNVTAGGSMGVSVDTSDNTAVNGNTVFGHKAYGVEVASSNYAAVVGNTIDGNDAVVGSQGVILDGTASTHAAIVGNAIRRVKGSGIHVQGGATFFAITGNVVQMTYADYAINLSSSSGVVSGNTLDGNSVGVKGVFIDTCDHIAVIGNTIRSFTQNGIMIYATTAVTLDFILIAGNLIHHTAGTQLGTQLSGGAALGTSCNVTGNTPNVSLGGVRGTLVGQQVSLGTAPTISAGTQAGTGPTVSVTGTDTAGTISVTTGTTPAAGWLATVNFAMALPASPKAVLFTGKNAAAAALQPYASSSNANGIDLSCVGTPVAATVYTFHYLVMG